MSGTVAPHGGIRATFDNLKILAKISIGFGLVLVILGVVGGIASDALSRIGDNFGAFRQLTGEVEVAADIDREFMDVRRNAREFALTGDKAREAATADGLSRTNAAIARGLDAIRNPERRQKVRDIAEQVTGFMDIVGRITESRNSQQALHRGHPRPDRESGECGF